MRASLRVLLSEIVDYAGLFPPAGLPLDEAIRNYARYRGEPESWMLGRFICPAGKLAELFSYRDLFSDESPLALAVLFRSSEETGVFLDELSGQISAAKSFQSDAAWARIEAFETRIPAEVKGEDVQQFLARVAQAFQGADFAMPLEVYELVLNEEWRNVIARFSSVAEPERPERDRPRAQLKLRTGGVESAAFPSPGRVASVIESCRDAGVPLKFTAGLHHPFRRYDASVQTHMHGFVNVFAAGVLARTHRLDQHDILAIIEEEDPRRFIFTDDFLGWNDFEASLEEVREARQHRAISFGSCSFDEPREDLKRLGLLD